MDVAQNLKLNKTPSNPILHLRLGYKICIHFSTTVCIVKKGYDNSTSRFSDICHIYFLKFAFYCTLPVNQKSVLVSLECAMKQVFQVKKTRGAQLELLASNGAHMSCHLASL